MNYERIKIVTIRTYLKVRGLLDLKEDFDESGARESILENIDFRSGNAWGLIFAILIASVGLHVNSTAVIIGAMLISPLMGPIVGAGFSLGIHDFENLKRSIVNLSYAVIISIVTSALFFILAPSSGAHSELIARTQPNFYDVLIALFGGAAGIVASTRKNKTNAIPGVAIATALMPPLCTVGYGIANLTPTYSLGALYLFLINTLFIFLSTYIFVRILNFQTLVDKSPEKDRFIHKWMGIASFIIIVPSLFMVWYLHKKTSFEVSASNFIENEIASNKLIVGKPKISFGLQGSIIKLKVFGDAYSKDEMTGFLKDLVEKYKILNTDLVVTNEERDLLKESELDQKYLSRQEFLNIQQVKLTSDRTKLTDAINSINKNNISFSVSLNSNAAPPIIEVQWKKKPNFKEIQKSEILIWQSLAMKAYIFHHK